ncbi:MAG: hypothetical protein AAGM22_25155 [Acidobacteriota bacterium]
MSLQVPRPVVLLASLVIALGTVPACADGSNGDGSNDGGSEAVGFSAEAGPTTLAVRTPDPAVGAALKSGPMQRWVLPQRPDLRLLVAPDADGEVLVETCALPAPTGKAPDLGARPGRLVEFGFRFGSGPAAVTYTDRDLAFAVRRPSSSRWVACGFQAKAVAALVDRVLRQETGVRFWRRQEPFDYMVYEHEYSRRSGHWRLEDGRVSPAADERDDLKARAATYAALETLEGQQVHIHIPPDGVEDPRGPALADSFDRDIVELQRRLVGEPPSPTKPVEVIVERNYVEQGRHLGQINPAVVSRGRLHVVFHGDDLEFYRVEMARLLLRRAGLELPPVLEDGAAVWLARSWYGRHFKDWMPDLGFARVLPTVDELTSGERPGDGSRVLFPIAVAWGLDQLPGVTLTEKLRGGRAMERVAAAVAGYRPPIQVPGGTAEPRKLPDLPFQRGVSFAMANGLEVGYHAPGVDDQLAKLRDLGVYAVSLMPFAYQPNPRAPGLSFLNDSPSSETDVGAIHAARRARAAGFYVLWKPHIWVSFESWPGDIEMTSEADWASWWRSYRRYVMHHAILARFADADLFSLGVELGKTVHREAEWRHLIAAVRRLDVSPLTYAGNWAGDYDITPFWDALDVVGIDAYFPLAATAEADDAELRRGARAIVERLAADAERFDRPILMTEVGFAARRGAWIAPHEEGGELSDEHQRRAWLALLEELGQPSWLRGLYPWKVFSHSSFEQATGPDFRFLERPAVDVLERYYKTLGPDAPPP